jgi:hypothetical protein
MRYLIVRTEIRPMAANDLRAAWIGGSRPRDEPSSPETRRQMLSTDDLDSALKLAKALSAGGLVRTGRHRIKIVRLESPALQG